MFSMSTFSQRRVQILRFIREYTVSQGRAPSLEEIAAACGLKSRSAAHKHVKALKEAGELEVTAGKARSARPKQRPTATQTAASLFEVTARDVAALDDSDLRELVARLAQARLAEARLPSTFVSWGGNQRAPDGGIDVRVHFPPGTDPADGGFVREITGIQVKATRMRARDIQNEMCPNGLLRPSIVELIRAKGSYVIAANDSPADAERIRRLEAMRTAVAGEEGNDDLLLEYYDARALADWACRHAGVVAWVRSRLGRPLQGWRPYGSWTDTQGGNPTPFVPDESARFDDPHVVERKISLVEGLAHVRDALRTGGRAVRLIGLSGVGKTRFAQALFEADAAPNPLAPELAVYTDLSNNPDPSPAAVLEELLSNGRHAILVVDNCGTQLHKQLAARCKSSRQVSLLTIEYDIREELRDETAVFSLSSASDELIQKVLAQQFPHVSQVNIATIVRVSGGNARVAIALANTLQRNESLAGLSDTQLFDRLFWLGKDVNHDLMVAAQTCALVYSFNVEDLDGELAQLAALAGQSAAAVFRHVGDLEHRGLAQRRGVWRAILPHAIANTLAKRALAQTHPSLILRHLVKGQDRLLRSFSRRLGFLHDSPEAVAIVQAWLAPDGLLQPLADLSELQVDALENIAPVSPEATLAAIERALEGPDAERLLGTGTFVRTRFVRLVRAIAWDATFFDRCLAILLRFALAEPEDTRTDPTRSVISSLFSLYLSGTHATITQRANWVEKLLLSSRPELRAIGRDCLGAALESYHFSSVYGFEFGARDRDYGWTPTRRQAHEWFAAFIELAVRLALGPGPAGEFAREALASHFRSLWAFGMVDALEQATAPLLDAGWEKGWLAIRQTLRFDGKGMPPEIKARLEDLGTRAAPKTLVSRVRAVVLNGQAAGLDFMDGESASSSYERAEKLARNLGQEVAQDAEAFATLAPLAVTNEQGRQWSFGTGLADAAPSLTACWQELVRAFEAVPETQRNLQVLRGFMRGVHERNAAVFEDLLDASMKSTTLAKWVPVLQLSAPLNLRGCERLLRAMDDVTVPAWVFRYLALGRATQDVPEDVLASMLQRLSIKPEGLAVVLEILSMHIYDNPNPIGPQLRQLARTLLPEFAPSKGDPTSDHSVGRLISFFLSDEAGEPVARQMLQALGARLASYSLSRYDLSETLAALFQVHPLTALDTLVGDADDSSEAHFRRRELAGGRRMSALSKVPIDSLLAWCRQGPESRWTTVAPLLPAFQGGQGSPIGWSEAVLTLLRNAPHPEEVASQLLEVIRPSSWSGPRSEAIAQRLPLLDELARELGEQHAELVARWRERINEEILLERRREQAEHESLNERFE